MTQIVCSLGTSLPMFQSPRSLAAACGDLKMRSQCHARWKRVSCICVLAQKMSSKYFWMKVGKCLSIPPNYSKNGIWCVFSFPAAAFDTTLFSNTWPWNLIIWKRSRWWNCLQKVWLAELGCRDMSMWHFATGKGQRHLFWDGLVVSFQEILIALLGFTLGNTPICQSCFA